MAKEACFPCIPIIYLSKGKGRGGAYLILWPQGWALFWGGWGVHGGFFEKLQYVQMSRHSAMLQTKI